MKQYMMIFNEDLKAKLSLVLGGVEFLEVVGMSTNQQGQDYSILMTPVNKPVTDIPESTEEVVA